jgi:hypothetical protein
MATNNRIIALAKRLGAIGYWDGNASSGPLSSGLKDWSGNGHHGSVGTGISQVTGASYRHTPALDLSVANTGINVGALPELIPLTGFTFSATLVLDNFTNNHLLFECAVDNYHKIQCYYYVAANALYLLVVNNSSVSSVTGARVTGFSSVVTAGVEFHIVVRVNLTAASVSCSVNGIYTTTSIIATLPATSANLSGVNFVIGYGALDGIHFDGKIDELCIFGRALTDLEFIALYLEHQNGKSFVMIGSDNDLVGGDTRPTNTDLFTYQMDNYPATAYTFAHIQSGTGVPYPTMGYRLSDTISAQSSCPVSLIGCSSLNLSLLGSASTSWGYRNPTNHADPTNIYGNAIKMIQDSLVPVTGVICNVGISDITSHPTEAAYLEALITLHERFIEDIGYEVPMYICSMGAKLTGTPADADACDEIRRAQVRFHDPVKGRYLVHTSLSVPRQDSTHFSQAGQDTRGQQIAAVILGLLGNGAYSRFHVPILKSDFGFGLKRRVTVELNPQNQIYNSTFIGFQGYTEAGWVDQTSAVLVEYNVIEITFPTPVTVVRQLHGLDPVMTYAIRENDTIHNLYAGPVIEVDSIISRPLKRADFALFDAIDPVSNQYNVVEPPQAMKDFGWSRHQIMTRQHLNWIHRTTGEWLRYLDQYASLFDNTQFDQVTCKFDDTGNTETFVVKYKRLFNTITVLIPRTSHNFTDQTDLEFRPVSGIWPPDLCFVSASSLAFQIVVFGFGGNTYPGIMLPSGIANHAWSCRIVGSSGYYDSFPTFAGNMGFQTTQFQIHLL